MLDYSIKFLPDEVKLTGLAEECAELIQAALKLRRVWTGDNPTPVGEKEAIAKLYEEIADVQLYILALELRKQEIERIMAEKEARWANRLKESAITESRKKMERISAAEPKAEDAEPKPEDAEMKSEVAE